MLPFPRLECFTLATLQAVRCQSRNLDGRTFSRTQKRICELRESHFGVMENRRAVAKQQQIKIQVKQLANALLEARGIIHHLLAQ